MKFLNLSRMSSGKTTIKDIARRLDLAVSTVSRALNDSWEVSAETRERVLKAAREMDYHPNTQARGLVTRCSKVVGLVVPDLLSSTFFATIAKQIQATLHPQGYQVIVMQSNESSLEERRLIEILRGSNADGIIICTANDSCYNRSLFENLLREKTALVFISRVCQMIPVPKIVVNDEEMAFRVTRHLVQQGCRSIAYIAGPEGIPASQERQKGYIRALEESHLPIREDMVIPTGLFVEDGIEAALRLLDSGCTPDGIFAINDTVAFGVMKTIRQRGLRIPEDIAVAGFSESFAATLVEPQLTTVAQPLEEMGRLASKLLLKQLEGFEPADTTLTLEGELRIRASSLRLKE